MLSGKLNFVSRFNPRQLPGLQLWMDGADSSTMYANTAGSTPTLGSGAVLRWSDKSGNNRHALAARVVTSLTLGNQGTGYTSAPTVTITPAAGDTTGSGATATATVSGGKVTALTLTNRGSNYSNNPVVSFSGGGGSGATAATTASVNATRQESPPGVMMNNGSLAVIYGPYLEIPAITIPQDYTVFSVYYRLAGTRSFAVGTGFSTPSEAAPQGSRYVNYFFDDNRLYECSNAPQQRFTTHQPPRGNTNELVIVKTVRQSGVSVSTQINDFPTSTITPATAINSSESESITNPSTGQWTFVSGDVALQGSPATQVMRPHRGAMHEIIVYDRVLTEGEQAAVKEYLRAKWAVSFAWTPALLPNLTAWYDAADASTFSLSGTNVTQWRDKSGFGRHLGQSTAASQPTYNATANNGRPAVVASSSGKLIATSSPAAIPYDYSRTSCLMVCSFGPTADLYEMPISLIENPAGSGSAQFFLRRSVTSNTLEVFSAVGGTVLPTNDAIIGAIYESAVRRDAFINGTQFTGSVNSSMSGVSATTQCRLFGVSNFFVGQISEVVLCNASISNTDRQRLEGYLAHKWGLAGSLPANHPHKASPP